MTEADIDRQDAIDFLCDYYLWRAQGKAKMFKELLTVESSSMSYQLLSFILHSILFSVSKNRLVAMGAPKKSTPMMFQPNMCHHEV